MIVDPAVPLRACLVARFVDSETEKQRWLSLYSEAQTGVRELQASERKRNLSLGVTTAEEMAALEKEEEHDAVAAAPWVADHAEFNCLICEDPFSALNRRHHCRLCGLLVCQKCSGSKGDLSGALGLGSSERVCDSCIRDKNIYGSFAEVVKSQRERERREQEQARRLRRKSGASRRTG